MSKALVIAAAFGVAIIALGVKTVSVSAPEAEAVSNTLSVYDLHRSIKDLPVQDIKDPI
jgi:hypothetical protein